jgi:hypothetical protein
MTMRLRLLQVAVGGFLFLGLTLDISAQDSTGTVVHVFGPKPFAQGYGGPVRLSETLSVPTFVHGPFTLSVKNGTSKGTNRVSSATVLLNGAIVLAPADFNANVSSLERRVQLLPLNLLQVEIRGGTREAFLEITLTGNVDRDEVSGTRSTNLGAQGGLITLQGGATLNVPNGALSGPGEVEVELSSIYRLPFHGLFDSDGGQ